MMTPRDEKMVYVRYVNEFGHGGAIRSIVLVLATLEEIL